MNRYSPTIVRKMTAYPLCCAGLTRSPFVLTEHIFLVNTDMKQYLIFKKCMGMLINYRRASEMRETLLVVVQ